MYDLDALDSSLSGTIFAGKLHFSPVTGSTNSDAVAAARNATPHGSVYFSDEQLTGRGRGDHGWVSAAGKGLYVSVLLRPQIPAARLPLLPLAAGLAAADAIRAVSLLTVDLRWPNDLLIGPRKAGGILVEAKFESKSLPHAVAVAGIGINVHQRAFPPRLATPATSLDLEAGRPISRQAVLVALLKSLEREALVLASPDAAKAIVARVEKASTWMRGRRVEVHGPQACSGVTAGLDENGFLRVMTADGLVTVQTGGLRAKD
ncbi:MAG: biotin--[acetyl-CoA-carboxylase] ligase [Terracidiphilus sp.]|jgi:BirA family biotin operon repressor/biotin-[acetyl-CoA-carboxylase] ligase